MSKPIRTLALQFHAVVSSVSLVESAWSVYEPSYASMRWYFGGCFRIVFKEFKRNPIIIIVVYPAIKYVSVNLQEISKKMKAKKKGIQSALVNYSGGP